MDTREEPCSVTNMQRLYVGGLSHTVNERELKERFGKFGAVHDVELRTRKDDDGVPYKTFGYISMNISEGHLKKCMTVLNKSKWKGGTLQIEVAKESFLHKLAQERQTEEERRLQKPEVVDKRQKMLEALSSVGVNNFVMKAAVPGTEIEGHEDWVVSKFGRVLPVLQLGSPKGNGRGSFKYDPSKYCHNIRKLDTATEDSSTPVSKLTWEVRGGDDDISKKRRGEFPPYVPPRPKKKAKVIPDANLITPARPTNGFRPETKPMSSQSRVQNWLDSDSDGEIRRIVESQAKSNGGGMRDEQDDEMEVVGLDYLVKSKEKNLQIRDKPADGDDYDSADTDELIASKKPPSSKRQPVPPAAKDSDSKSVQRKGKQKRNPPDENKEPKEELVCKSRRKASTDQPSGKTTNGILMAKSSESKSEEDESDSSDSASVSDYEAMFSNVTRLEISMTDLQKLAEESQQPSETPGPSSLDNVSFTPTKEPKTPKKDTTPEDILASLMGGGFDNEKEMKTTTGRKSLPPFMGTKMLNDQVEEQTVDSGLVSQDMSPTERIKEGTNEKRVVNEKQNKTLESSQLTDEKMEEEGKSRVGKKEEDVKKCKLIKTNIALKSIPKNNLTNMESIGRSSSSSSDEDDDDDEDEATTQKLVKTSGAEVKASSSAHKESPLTKVASKISGPSCSQSKSSSSEDDDDDEEETMQTSGAKVKASSSAVKASPLTKVASKKSGPSCDRNKSSSSEEDEDEGTTQKLVKTSAAKVKASSSAVKASPLTKVASNKSGPSCSQRESSSSEEDDDDDDEEEERKKEVQVKPRTPRAAAEEKELQRKANLRRLAAVQQRQKEAEEHKKLIQGALAKLDAPTTKGGKHIVFGSDEDDDDEEEEGETKSRKTLLQDSSSEDESEAKKGNEKQTQLFSSSSDDEEEDDDDANKEEKRFEIKPQFEGEAGKKLMELQSRFGTDERFRMNSRFLEEEEEKDGDEEAESEKQTNDESLTDEKKKNLSILQSVLGVDQAYSKPAAKAKTFRDVSALHYDPSREEHAVFEAKPEEKKKESKASRKKKREEAQKLPEVSKDIYFDVSGDLKSVFGFEKDKEVTAEEKGSWDQQEEAPAVEDEEEEEQQEEEEPQLSVADAEEKESGFKFSFFGDDAEEECAEEVEYKVEKISASKVSWQQDPRLQDSSSEEEEDEEDKQEVASTTTTTETETALTQELFFFFPDDIRLTEGPRCFCRPPQLEEKMEEWEEKRGLLRQEYRKKHKDAKRQLKINNRS